MLSCPTCHQPIDEAPDLAGQMVACPACGGLMTMPIVGQLVIPDQPAIRASTRPVHRRRQSSPVAVIATAVVLAGVVLIAAFFVCKVAYDEWQIMRGKQELRQAVKDVEQAFDKMEQEIEESERRRRENAPKRYIPPKY